MTSTTSFSVLVNQLTSTGSVTSFPTDIISLSTNNFATATIAFTSNANYLGSESITATITALPPSGIPSETAQAQQSSGGGLNTGAAAGIGVGATLGVVALIVVLILLWRRHRKATGKASARQDELEKDGNGANFSTGPEDDIKPVEAPHTPSKRVEAPNTLSKRVEAPNAPSIAEAEDSPIAELDGGGHAAELDGGRKAAELDVKV